MTKHKALVLVKQTPRKRHEIRVGRGEVWESVIQSTPKGVQAREQWEKNAAPVTSPMTATARAVRSQVANVKRPHITPPSPSVVKPTPQPPAIEPTTAVAMPVKLASPSFKAGLKDAWRKRRRPGGAEDYMGEPQDNMWSGSQFSALRRGPENDVVGDKTAAMGSAPSYDLDKVPADIKRRIRVSRDT